MIGAEGVELITDALKTNTALINLNIGDKGVELLYANNAKSSQS